jgi:DNA-binding transcriptional ArsR family regulator
LNHGNIHHPTYLRATSRQIASRLGASSAFARFQGFGSGRSGVMAEQLDIAASALSFHLKELVHSGLASCEPRGRNLIYRANFEHMNALLTYLTEHCCQGQACAVPDVAACSTC